MILQVFFWFCIIAIFHSYVIYPLILRFLALGKQENSNIYTLEDDLPHVSILVAVYNEEQVIEEKVRSVFAGNYPISKIELIIGSDESTDKTNFILVKLAEEFPQLRFFPLKPRMGKGNVLNSIVKEAKSDLLVYTDAKVILRIDTVYQLIKHLKEPAIGLVGGKLLNKVHNSTGISIQENAFMRREFVLKHQEGLIWGSMVGAYGALYAIRKNLVPVIPVLFIVDDFYITLKVLEGSEKAILNPEAIGYLNVPNEMKEEFRRKVRIAKGNFQNLFAFHHILWPPWKGSAFSYFSHKVLRWLGPFFILSILLCNFFLLDKGFIYILTISFQIILLIIPALDYVLRKLGIHILFLRFITHFYGMNAALLAGFLNYVKGIKSNVWEPTRR
jgi:cellulose synthase/poly-beta-1,6-N-acetylglucosamine synthase-like glycosyltransferase